jgi:hypothetical protein
MEKKLHPMWPHYVEQDGAADEMIDAIAEAVAADEMAVIQPVGQTAPPVYREPKRRIRNYKVMKDEKLADCYYDLESGYGDAVDRCITKGSGDILRDLAVVEAEMRKRGLI